MNTPTKQKEKGFTIIEVVLVLAIAALIFLMVFIALPALQRGQRDTQRKSDISRVQTALNNYQSNNRGILPAGETAWKSFLTSYLKSGGDDFTDPTGKPYIFAESTNDTLEGGELTTPDKATTDVTIYYTEGAKCDGENVAKGQGARKVAFRLVLEGGGIACVNN